MYEENEDNFKHDTTNTKSLTDEEYVFEKMKKMYRVPKVIFQTITL